jgi:hypothetical protein
MSGSAASYTSCYNFLTHGNRKVGATASHPADMVYVHWLLWQLSFGLMDIVQCRRHDLQYLDLLMSWATSSMNGLSAGGSVKDSQQLRCSEMLTEVDIAPMQEMTTTMCRMVVPDQHC